jgi:perosamine synthetase
MIPVNEPLMAANALTYVSECIETGWISSAGKFIQRFEQEFARFQGTEHAVTTTSGTTALHLALVSLNIGPGDEVITSDLTMIAVPYAILYTGATPVLVDVERDTFNIAPSKIKEFIVNDCRFDKQTQTLLNKGTQGRVKAILPIHLYGHPCDMDAITALAEEFNLLVIEDAAEAHGARYFSPRHGDSGRMAGSIGDIGCFSFYANKIITTGEGGMIVTDSDSLADRARRLKDLAHAPEQRFLHTDLAFNYRMTNLQAAVGVAQLEEIDRFLQIKENMAFAYNERLQGVEGLTLPVEKDWAKNVYWMYSILIEDEFGLSRDLFIDRLRERGVDTRTFFIPVHRQPVLSLNPCGQKQDFPVSDELSRKGLYLPSGLALTDVQIQTVCEAIKEIKSDL